MRLEWHILEWRTLRCILGRQWWMTVQYRQTWWRKSWWLPFWTLQLLWCQHPRNLRQQVAIHSSCICSTWNNWRFPCSHAPRWTSFTDGLIEFRKGAFLVEITPTAFVIKCLLPSAATKDSTSRNELSIITFHSSVYALRWHLGGCQLSYKKRARKSWLLPRVFTSLSLIKRMSLLTLEVAG